MAVYQYPKLNRDNDCEPCSVGEGEDRYPTAHFDVLPAQLDGLEPGDDVTIVLTGKLNSFRMDTDDSWGTGASIGLSLRSSEIQSKKVNDAIESMISEE